MAALIFLCNPQIHQQLIKAIIMNKAKSEQKNPIKAVFELQNFCCFCLGCKFDL